MVLRVVARFAHWFYKYSHSGYSDIQLEIISIYYWENVTTIEECMGMNTGSKHVSSKCSCLEYVTAVLPLAIIIEQSLIIFKSMWFENDSWNICLALESIRFQSKYNIGIQDIVLVGGNTGTNLLSLPFHWGTTSMNFFVRHVSPD